jgi:cytoskeletal protein CcmA (bactofilin family)
MAMAFGARSGDEVTLAKTETHQGTLYAAGQNVTIDGNVDGDLFCGGNVVTINGNVSGDVICAGQNLTLNGKVAGNARVAGQTVIINGAVGRNVSAAAQSFTLGRDGRVDGEIALVGQVAQVNGPVNHDLYGAVRDLSLASTVGGSFTMETDGLHLRSAAHVTGDLNYTSAKTFQIAAAQVSGHVNRHEPPRAHTESPRSSVLAWLLGRAYWILATVAIAFTLIWLVPRFIPSVTGVMSQRPGASIGWGLLLLFVGPLALVLIAITFIGLPLALFLGVLWLVGVGLAGMLTSLAIGRWILAQSDWNKTSLPLAALVGVPITMLAFGIPIMGSLLAMVSMWWALGGLALSIHHGRLAVSAQKV